MRRVSLRDRGGIVDNPRKTLGFRFPLRSWGLKYRGLKYLMLSGYQDVEHQGERYKLINIPYCHAPKIRDYGSLTFRWFYFHLWIFHQVHDRTDVRGSRRRTSSRWSQTSTVSPR
jgi:hypothetical protein